jgi:hypothetical protein
MPITTMAVAIPNSASGEETATSPTPSDAPLYHLLKELTKVICAAGYRCRNDRRRERPVVVQIV